MPNTARRAKGKKLANTRPRTDDELPAGLEGPGRADELESGSEVYPTGSRSDYRASAPGTEVPAKPKPRTARDVVGRIRRALADGVRRRRG